MPPLLRYGIDSRDNKVAPLVPVLLPDFVREMHPKFVTFLRKYFEWAEREGDNFNDGGAIWAIRSLLDFQDIDLTEEALLEQFHKELAPTIPRALLSNKRTLFKNIIDFHRARGTEKSYEFLFRVLFNDRIDFYYPSQDMWRTSDNTWVVNKTIRVFSITGDPFNFVDKLIYGVGSNTQAVVERVLKYQIGIFPVYELFLTPKTIDGGVFESGEIIQTEDEAITASIYGCVTGVTITDPGTGYEEGDVITISGGGGTNCNVVVGAVGLDGEVKSVSVIDPGVNYKTVPTVTFPAAGDTATGTAVIGPLVTYSGFFLNENGFVSATKYIQDSYFYQQFSYVVRSNQSINLYKDIVKQTLHPSGLILFGAVFVNNIVKDEIEALNPSGNSISGIQMIHNESDPIELFKSTTGIVHTPTLIPDEDAPWTFGPTYDWLDRFKFSSLPHDPRFDVARRLPGCKLWVHDDGIETTSDNRVVTWPNKSLHPITDGGFIGPDIDDFKPLLTRPDNKENLLRRSETFTQGDWVVLGVTNLDYSATDSGGDPKAAEMTAVAGVSVHQMTQTSSISAGLLANAGTSYVLSFEVKKSAVARYVWIGDLGDSVQHSATFDLDSSGALVSSTNTTGTSVTSLGSGWYKISITFTRTATDDFNIGLAINGTGHSASPESWNAIGTEIIFFSAAQCRSADADTDYIPTFQGPEIRGHNGNRMIWFDGSNDYMQSTELMSDLVSVEEARIYVVFKVRTVETDDVTVNANEAVLQDLNSNFGLYLKSSGAMIFLHNDGVSDSVEQPLVEDQVYVASIRHSGGNITFSQNETDLETSEVSGDTSLLTDSLFLARSFTSATVGSLLPNFPPEYFSSLFPSTSSGGEEYAKICIGEIIICDQAPSAALEDELLGYLKKKWLDIDYRRASHWMSAPNEDYWDTYGNFTVKDRGSIVIDDIQNYPRKRTNFVFEPYLLAKEVISDLEEIIMDLTPQYEVLRSVSGGVVDWIKEQRKNVLRFEPGGISSTRPSFTEVDSEFNGMPSLTFDGTNDWLNSETLVSSVMDADLFFGRVVFRTTDEMQTTGNLITANQSPASWGLYINAGNLEFIIDDGIDTFVASVPIDADTNYIASFKLAAGVLTLEVIGGGATQSDVVTLVGDIEDVAQRLTIGGRGVQFFDGKIARVILGKTQLSLDDSTLLDSILSTKYGVSGA